MLVRLVHFVIGLALGAGGGYLVWTYRASANAPLFPPGPEGLPWLVIAGLAAAIAGLVFLVAAVIPRPKRAAQKAAAAAWRESKLSEADTYYAKTKDAPQDRDWRSGLIPPEPKPQPAPEPPKPEPIKSEPPRSEPARLEPARPEPIKPEPVAKPAPAANPIASTDDLFEPVAPAAPSAQPAPLEPMMTVVSARPAAGKPTATGIPPEGAATPFPSAATLAPIPRSSDPPPPPAAANAAPVVAGGYEAIRAAITEGRLDEADRMLTAEKDRAQGEALAELTGLAGDHAAAAGRQSNAKWLWRLALKRFGECNAMNSPAARAVSERLRLSDN
jgi:hypothetical protein